MLYPFLLQPLFRQYLWGGRRLETVLGKTLPTGAHYAESWEVVDRGEDQSVIVNGPLAGQTLAQVRQRDGHALLGRHVGAARFPLLFKYLDAQQTLSVQVHPDDAQAARLQPPDLGKTEAWVVVAADAGSRIYAGLKAHVGRETLEQAIREGKLVECLHSVEPQVGDAVFIPAGVVHALGAGLMVAEIQQSSDATFRLYDWDRVGPDGKPRPLHIEQALQVIDFAYGPVFPIRPGAPDHQGRESLVHCPQFCLDRWHLRHPNSWGGDDRFHVLSVLEGSSWAGGSYIDQRLTRGQTVLLPAAAHLQLTPIEPTTVLDMYLP